MVRITGLIIGCLLLAGPALAEKASVEVLTGGGSISQGGGIVLNGAIAGAGLPGDVAGLSQGGGFWLSVGFYPVLVSQAFAENFADPVWLELSQSLRPVGLGLRTMVGLIVALTPGSAKA